MDLKFRLQVGHIFEFKYSKYSEFIDNLEPEPGVIINVLEPFTLEDFETAQIEYNKYVVYKEALEDIITTRKLWSKEELREFSKYDLNNPVLEWLMIRDNREDKEIKEILSLVSFEIGKIEKGYTKYYEEKKYFLNSLLCYLLCYLSDNPNQQKFNFLCRIGSLKVAQWIYKVSNLDSKPINIHYVDEFCFRFSCEEGHLEVAQWLYSLGDVDIHARDDYAFKNSCMNGHLEVAQWIYLICQSPGQSSGEFFGGINIQTRDDYVFRWTCVRGHIEVAQWLYSLGGVNIHVCDEEAFRLACLRGHLEVAQWLYSLGGIDIYTQNEYAFKYACYYGRLEVAQWLWSLGGFHKDNIKSDYEDIKDWLATLD